MESLRLAYVAVFGGAGLLCLVLTPRARVVSDPDTRRGLASLLAVAGVWAGVAAAQVVVDAFVVKSALYVLGLAVGLAAVLPWLWFCSAYAGRELHRDRRLQAAALAVYLLVLAVKFTNPVHGLYFTTTLAATPFPHLAVQRLALDWVVTGAAYLAAGYGFLLLYSTLTETEYGTASLWAVFGVAALPVVPAALAATGIGALLPLNYEPVGVALFAAGALYFTEEKFDAVGRYGYASVFDDLGEAVVVLDTDGRVRRTNRTAVAAFPALDGAEGRRLGTVAPALADDRETVLTVEEGETERHFVRRATPLEVGATGLGTAVVLTDVTEIERKRRELERQNDQLDDFAAAIDHELRNTVAIAAGYTEFARDRLDDDAATDDALAVVDETLERMRGVSEDLATLARHGQTVSRTAPCDLASAARRAWRTAGGVGADLELTVDTGERIHADEPRLVDLFAAAFDFAATEGASRVRVDLDGRTLVVTADCEPVPADRAAEAFDYDAAVPSAEAGMLLPNVRTLAAVHGWTADIDPTYRAGVRLEVSGVERAPTPRPSGDTVGRTSQRT